MLYVLFGSLVFCVDQYFKDKIEKRSGTGERELAHGWIRITRHHNEGAFLSILKEQKTLLKWISFSFLGILLVACGLLLKNRGGRLWKTGVFLMTGGAASNVSDRLTKGYVVDYFSFRRPSKVVFNLGDMGIFVGAFLICWAQIRNKL